MSELHVENLQRGQQCSFRVTAHYEGSNYEHFQSQVTRVRSPIRICYLPIRHFRSNGYRNEKSVSVIVEN
jgi:hypothetical protein